MQTTPGVCNLIFVLRIFLDYVNIGGFVIKTEAGLI